MWNLHEFGIFLKKTFKGALWGVIIAILMLFYNEIAELWNCFCNILIDDFSLPEVANERIPVFGFIVCVALGMITGIVSATKACNTRIKRQKQVRETQNYGQVCGCLSQLAETANGFSNILAQHKNDVEYYGEDCCAELNEQANKCEELYGKLLQSYEAHTKVKGEA